MDVKVNVGGVEYFNRVEKIGRFTIARVKEIKGKKVITGIGIARLSDNDQYKKDIAEKIALGRANKALIMKKNGQKIHNLLMG